MSDAPLSTRPVVIFYLLMTLVAAVVGFWRGHVRSWIDPETLPLDLGLGVGVGLAVVVISRLGMWVPAIRSLSGEFGEILRELSLGQVALFALLSGIGEEALFRGVLQPELGWPLATLLFAAVHVGPGRRFLWWTGFALIVGAVFAQLALHRGNIVSAVVAHALINLLNLRYLSRLGSGDPLPPEPSREWRPPSA